MSDTACYLVRRVGWEGGELEYGFLTKVVQDEERRLPVVIFATEREAKTDAHRRNVEARAGRSPFWFTEKWEELTDLTTEDATARLVRKGFAGPFPHLPADYLGLWQRCNVWREWWDRESVNWTAEQLADAWAVFDKLRFYDVVEIEMEG